MAARRLGYRITRIDSAAGLAGAPAARAGSSVGKGEARLHALEVEHHPGEPHQQANHARHRGDAARSAEEQFQQADFFHGRQRSLAHYGWRSVAVRRRCIHGHGVSRGGRTLEKLLVQRSAHGLPRSAPRGWQRHHPVARWSGDDLDARSRGRSPLNPAGFPGQSLAAGGAGAGQCRVHPCAERQSDHGAVASGCGAGLIAMASQRERFTPKLFSLLERVGVLLTSSTRGSHRFGSPHI